MTMIDRDNDRKNHAYLMSANKDIEELVKMLRAETARRQKLEAIVRSMGPKPRLCIWLKLAALFNISGAGMVYLSAIRIAVVDQSGPVLPWLLVLLGSACLMVAIGCIREAHRSNP